MLISGERKTEARRKTLGGRGRTNNKLNPHMTTGPGIEPGTHLWAGRRALSPLRHPCPSPTPRNCKKGLNVSSYIKVKPHAFKCIIIIISPYCPQRGIWPQQAFKCREGKIKGKLTSGAKGSSVQRQII